MYIIPNHWAVGWVESIYIHQSDTEHCAQADAMLADLDDYPVLSEDDWSALEDETAYSYWSRCSLSERVDWCRRYGVSIFAARRAHEIPDDDTGDLMRALAE
jgi:hypothetical protein